MELSAYLARERLTREEFGLRVKAHPITVSKWSTKSMLPRPSKAREIVEATGGAVTLSDLRPDIWPAGPTTSAEAA